MILRIRRPYALLLLAFPVGVAAYDVAPLAPPEVEKSTAPALTIDSWKPAPPPPRPAPPPVALPDTIPAAPPAPTPPPPSATAVPAAPAVHMNEMTGTLTSIDADAQSLRLTVEGDVHPQVNYDAKTVVRIGDGNATLGQLKVGDKIVVRYVGKDLLAREINVINSH